MSENLTKLIDGLSPEFLEKMVTRLDLTGIVTDEEEFGLSSATMEYGYKVFEKVMRQNGYTGG